MAALKAAGQRTISNLKQSRILTRTATFWAKLNPFRKISVKFSLELLTLVFVLGAAYLSHSQAFTTLLVNQNNTSPAFKLLSRTHLNDRLMQVAVLSQSKEFNFPSLFSVASAADQSANVLGAADTSKALTAIVTTADNSAVVKPNYAVAPGLQNGNQIALYHVAAGDTPITIASRFGLSVATVLINNQLNDGSVIKPGQELKLPAVDGLVYKVKDGDTLASLASKYKVSEDDILNANDVETEEDLFNLGDEIVIPQSNLAVPKAPVKTTTRLATNNVGQIAASKATAPDDFIGGSGNMIWPTLSHQINQYFSGRHNGIDISCNHQNPGPNIEATDDGFIEYAGWQSGGWGNTIVENLGNGLKARYAHLSVIDVAAGQQVGQGSVLGRCGTTGRSTGPHLHFTIYLNGRAVNPLKYVSQ